MDAARDFCSGTTEGRGRHEFHKLNTSSPGVPSSDASHRLRKIEKSSWFPVIRLLKANPSRKGFLPASKVRRCSLATFQPI